MERDKSNSSNKLQSPIHMNRGDEISQAHSETACSDSLQTSSPVSTSRSPHQGANPEQSKATQQPSDENDVRNHNVENYFHHGIYSRASGLDVVGIMVKVATRKDPQIQLGNIDLSCAMVVCAADLPDEPIIYCTEGFETLTQYRNDEVLGRNCRFLQATNTPASQIDQPARVKSNATVKAQLKSGVAARQETQVEVLNYKKNGEPFVNLLSIIPVAGDLHQVKYLVGFMAGANRWNA